MIMMMNKMLERNQVREERQKTRPNLLQKRRKLPNNKNQQKAKNQKLRKLHKSQEERKNDDA